MPVISYLAYPKAGEKEALENDLRAIEFCDVTPAENEDVLILVTDTPNDKLEKVLQGKLKELPSLESLSMAFAHADA